LEEISEAYFRQEDLAEKRANAEVEEARAKRAADADDAYTQAEFMGKTITHEEFLADAIAYSDQLDEIEIHLAKREQARRLAGQEDRIRELEARLEQQMASSTRSEQRHLRTLSQANQVAAAFRRRAEQGAGFRSGWSERYRGADGNYYSR
jgi:hypothetical protein